VENIGKLTIYFFIFLSHTYFVKNEMNILLIYNIPGLAVKLFLWTILLSYRNAGVIVSPGGAEKNHRPMTGGAVWVVERLSTRRVCHGVVQCRVQRGENASQCVAGTVVFVVVLYKHVPFAH